MASLGDNPQYLTSADNQAGTASALAELATKVEATAKQADDTLQQVKGLGEKVDEQADEVSNTKVQVSWTQQITFFGFIIALITLGAIVIAAFTYFMDAMHESQAQTQLLQQINAKINK